MTDLERAQILEAQLRSLDCAYTGDRWITFIVRHLAAARREGAKEMRERTMAALAPIADEEMPEPYWDNARARRMDWACVVGRCLNRVSSLTPEEEPQA